MHHFNSGLWLVSIHGKNQLDFILPNTMMPLKLSYKNKTYIFTDFEEFS